MLAKTSRTWNEFKFRSNEVRHLVYELHAFSRKEIDVTIEKDLGGFLIKIISSRFNSSRPNAGIIKIKLKPNEFWDRHGPAHTTLKEKITDGLKEI